MTPTRLISVIALGLVLSVSCSNELSPTKTTPLSGPTSSDFSSAGSSAYRTPRSSALNDDEQFNCTNVGNANVRFSEPGWVQGNVVGLFVNYEGVTDTKVTLRIWWDFENAPESYEDVTLGGDEIRRNEELLEIEKTVEHTYADIREETVRTVRVHLILADQTGNCARVRRVTLIPPKVDAAPAPPLPPPVQICATGNEGTTVTLTCPVGQTMNSIVFASYGTPNGTCGSFTIGGCHAVNSTTIVSAACLGNGTCSVAANNAVFGDPCGGTFKRMYLEATCQ